MMTVLIILSILPFVFLLTQTVYTGGLLFSIGNVSGYIGVVLMMWQVVLGMRFISHKIRPDLVRNTKLHIFLGTYGLLLVFAHPIIQILKYDFSIITNFSFLDPFYSKILWGKLAFLIFTLIFITSAVLRKKISYRLWLAIHYLNYLMIFLLFFHVKDFGTYYSSFTYISYYFNCLYLLFFSLVVFRTIRYFNIGKRRFVLVNKTNLNKEITEYQFKPLDKTIKISPGQFLFLRKDGFSESHPFTVADYDEQTGQINFCIKSVGKYTNLLTNLKKNDTVYIDGPYGVFTKEGQDNFPKVLFAGGIGITPFIKLVKDFSNDQTFLFYSNKLLSEAINREDFKKELGNNYVDFVTQERSGVKNVEEGRISSEKITRYISISNLKKSKIFICGPVPFMQSVKEILYSLGINKNQIFTEEFSL